MVELSERKKEELRIESWRMVKKISPSFGIYNRGSGGVLYS